jgi:hypothetical protein
VVQFARWQAGSFAWRDIVPTLTRSLSATPSSGVRNRRDKVGLPYDTILLTDAIQYEMMVDGVMEAVQVTI